MICPGVVGWTRHLFFGSDAPSRPPQVPTRCPVFGGFEGKQAGLAERFKTSGKRERPRLRNGSQKRAVLSGGRRKGSGRGQRPAAGGKRPLPGRRRQQALAGAPAPAPRPDTAAGVGGQSPRGRRPPVLRVVYEINIAPWVICVVAKRLTCGVGCAILESGGTSCDLATRSR